MNSNLKLFWLQS